MCRKYRVILMAFSKNSSLYRHLLVIICHRYIDLIVDFVIESMITVVSVTFLLVYNYNRVSYNVA